MTMTRKTNSGNATGVELSVCTNDIERLKSFYAELFGAEVYSRVPAKGRPFYVRLRLGSAHLGLVASKRGAAAEPGRSIVSVIVESVDDLLPRVEPAGGKVLGPAKDMRWGQRVAHIEDPDGNPVNLTQEL